MIHSSSKTAFGETTTVSTATSLEHLGYSQLLRSHQNTQTFAHRGTCTFNRPSRPVHRLTRLEHASHQDVRGAKVRGRVLALGRRKVQSRWRLGAELLSLGATSGS